MFYSKVSESCFPCEAVRARSYRGLAYSMMYGLDKDLDSRTEGKGKIEAPASDTQS